MTITKTISKKALSRIQKWLKSKNWITDKDEILHIETAIFDNNIEADIKVVNSSSGPYIDAVLFHNGYEVQTIEPSFDNYDGPYYFDYKGKKYTVVIQ